MFKILPRLGFWVFTLLPLQISVSAQTHTGSSKGPENNELPLLLDGTRAWRTYHNHESLGELVVAPTMGGRSGPLKLQGTLAPDASLPDSAPFFLAERGFGSVMDLSSYLGLRIRARGNFGTSSSGQIYVVLGDDLQPGVRWRANVTVHRPAASGKPSAPTSLYVRFSDLRATDVEGQLLPHDQLAKQSPLELRRVKWVGLLVTDHVGRFALQVQPPIVALREFTPPLRKYHHKSREKIMVETAVGETSVLCGSLLAVVIVGAIAWFLSPSRTPLQCWSPSGGQAQGSFLPITMCCRGTNQGSVLYVSPASSGVLTPLL